MDIRRMQEAIIERQFKVSKVGSYILGLVVSLRSNFRFGILSFLGADPNLDLGSQGSFLKGGSTKVPGVFERFAFKQIVLFQIFVVLTIKNKLRKSNYLICKSRLKFFRNFGKLCN